MTKNINYRFDIIPNAEAIAELYDDAGLNRPTHDQPRLAQMYAQSNLVVTAWEEENLVGVARSLTDFCYCCYLSDLAVAKAYQKKGIGKQLIRLTKEKIGDDSMLLLLSAATAMDYYPKVGMETVKNGFIIHRQKWA